MSAVPKLNLLSRNYVRVWLCVMISAVAFGAVNFARIRNKRSVESVALARNPAQTTTLFQQRDLRTNSVDSELVTLRATGFEPSELSRQAGRFLLAIDNQTELGDLAFRIVRENGVRVRDIAPKRSRFRLRQVIELDAGRYYLVVVNHAEWTCRIVITPP